MKSRLAIGLSAAVLGLGIFLWRSNALGKTSGVDSPNVTAVRAAVMPVAIQEKTGAHLYVGSKKCKMCHSKSHKSWSKTKMGQAFETLKPGHVNEIKQKFKLDVDKDYTKDETCLKCHTTGYGEPGGYAIPDPNDKKAVRKAKKLAGVGCESCHGPGSQYVKLHTEIMKSKRKYTLEEMYAAGMRKIDKANCITCHNGEGPTVDASAPFDYEKMKDEGIHDHEVIKQRQR